LTEENNEKKRKRAESETDLFMPFGISCKALKGSKGSPPTLQDDSGNVIFDQDDNGFYQSDQENINTNEDSDNDLHVNTDPDNILNLDGSVGGDSEEENEEDDAGRNIGGNNNNGNDSDKNNNDNYDNGDNSDNNIHEIDNDDSNIYWREVEKETQREERVENLDHISVTENNEGGKGFQDGERDGERDGTLSLAEQEEEEQREQLEIERILLFEELRSANILQYIPRFMITEREPFRFMTSYSRGDR
jgi:hypothetical protein